MPAGAAVTGCWGAAGVPWVGAAGACVLLARHRRGSLGLGGDFRRNLGGRLLAFLLRFDHRLVFRFVQGMDLGGAVGAFHFDMLEAQAGGFRRARGMLLPPEVAEADQQGEQ